MPLVLKVMARVKHFLDDILIYSKTWSEHSHNLEKVFGRLRNAGLTAQPTKSAL